MPKQKNFSLHWLLSRLDIVVLSGQIAKATQILTNYYNNENVTCEDYDEAIKTYKTLFYSNLEKIDGLRTLVDKQVKKVKYYNLIWHNYIDDTNGIVPYSKIVIADNPIEAEKQVPEGMELYKIILIEESELPLNF